MGSAKNPPRRTPAGGADPLMARIDRALAAWPATEPSAIERDEKAEGIVARAMEEDGADPSEPDFLSPPLPATREEGGSSRGHERGRIRAGLWLIAGGLAVATTAAVAAGVVFSVRARAPAEVSSLSTGSRPAAQATTSSAAAASAGPKVQPPPPDIPGIDPSELPLASAAAGSKPVSPPAGAKLAGASRATPAAAPAAPPEEPDAPLVDDSLRPAAAVGAGSSLAGGPGSVPRRPSMGAIQGALGAVLPAARACLGPGVAPCRATVTFQSDGTVRDVAFPGGAAAPAGAESCIRSALAGVRVPPFAEGAYGVPVTVRY